MIPSKLGSSSSKTNVRKETLKEGRKIAKKKNMKRSENTRKKSFGKRKFTENVNVLTPPSKEGGFTHRNK